MGLAGGDFPKGDSKNSMIGGGRVSECAESLIPFLIGWRLLFVILLGIGLYS